MKYKIYGLISCLGLILMLGTVGGLECERIKFIPAMIISFAGLFLFYIFAIAAGFMDGHKKKSKKFKGVKNGR